MVTTILIIITSGDENIGTSNCERLGSLNYRVGKPKHEYGVVDFLTTVVDIFVDNETANITNLVRLKYTKNGK